MRQREFEAKAKAYDAAAELVVCVNTGEPVSATIKQQQAELLRIGPVYEAARRWLERPFADNSSSALAAAIMTAEAMRRTT